MPSNRPSLSRKKQPDPKEVEAFIGAAGLPAEPGRKPPEGSVRMNVNLPRSLHRKLKIQSVQEERTITDIVVDLISTYLSEQVKR